MRFLFGEILDNLLGGARAAPPVRVRGRVRADGGVGEPRGAGAHRAGGEIMLFQFPNLEFSCGKRVFVDFSSVFHFRFSTSWKTTLEHDSKLVT